MPPECHAGGARQHVARGGATLGASCASRATRGRHRGRPSQARVGAVEVPLPRELQDVAPREVVPRKLERRKLGRGCVGGRVGSVDGALLRTSEQMPSGTSGASCASRATRVGAWALAPSADISRKSTSAGNSRGSLPGRTRSSLSSDRLGNARGGCARRLQQPSGRRAARHERRVAAS